jgi:branched-chain amino acid transport system permease protein
MQHLQTLVNGIVLGALYACLAVGFSLVWGVLNVINMLHGSFIILGGYITYYAWRG